MPTDIIKPVVATSNTESATQQKLRMKAILLSVLVSLVLLGLKFLTYYLTYSSAVLSDGLESIVNVVASAFATVSLWLAAKPPDPDHPYGHGKIEYFSAGFEGALIIFAAIGIFYTGIEHLRQPHELPYLQDGLIILSLATGINLLLALYLLRIGRDTDSLALIADGKHILTDVYTSGGVLIGLGLVYWTGWLRLDGIIACLVGINILFTGGKLISQSFRRLMDASDPDLLEHIASILEKSRRPDWIDIHQLRAWRAGSLIHVDLHLVLPQDVSLESAHKEAKALETILAQHFKGNVSVLIHMDPCQSAECPICGRPLCNLRGEQHQSRASWDRKRLVRTTSILKPDNEA